MKEQIPKFIHIEDRIINLQFVKSLRLDRGSLEITVPESGGGETLYTIHDQGAAIFERLQRECINYQP